MPAPLTNVKAALETLGWKVGFVERWIPQAMRRIDLFGFADYVAIDPMRKGTVYVQTTCSSGNGMKRVRKIQGLKEVVAKVLAAGNHVEVWEWNRYSPRGTKKVRVDAKRWVCFLMGGEIDFREVESYQTLLAKRFS